MKSVSEITGYYYIMYQATLNPNYIRCWINGEEDSELMQKEEFLNYVKLANDIKLLIEIRNNLDTTGIYMWFVDENKTTRMYPEREERSLREEINKLYNKYLK